MQPVFIRRELAKLESFNSNMVSASSSVDDLSFNEETSGVSNLSSDGTPPISMLPSSACSSFSSDVGEDLHVIREALMESEGTTVTNNGEEEAEEDAERETENPSRPPLQPRQRPDSEQQQRRQRSVRFKVRQQQRRRRSVRLRRWQWRWRSSRLD